ncbi:hypothetical protein HDU84_003387 [Entophlyctis sp. JEL0112]|nr:hypothetical protein HDU84_003387 [Entophlyctis sp. JEL0112]
MSTIRRKTLYSLGTRPEHDAPPDSLKKKPSESHNASSISTLALSVDNLRTASHPTRPLSSKEKKNYQWLSSPATDSVYTIHEEGVLRRVSADGDDNLELPQRPSASNIHLGQNRELEASRSGPKLNQPECSKKGQKDSAAGLKRWHNVTEELLTEPHQRKISGVSSNYSGSSVDSPKSEADESQSESENQSTESGSPDSSEPSNNSTQVDSISQKSRSASIGTQSGTSDEVKDQRKGLMKGDHIVETSAFYPKLSLNSGLPVLDEAEEDEERKLASRNQIPVISSSSGASAKRSQNSWKLPLPPLLKKLVHGNQHEKPIKPGTPPKVARRPILPSGMISPNAHPSLSPPSVGPKPTSPSPPSPKPAMSKPTTANLVTAVKQMTAALSKNRIGSDPGISKTAGAAGSSSKTLAGSRDVLQKFTGPMWETEDKARAEEARLGFSDEECFAAAKIRFEAKYKIQKQLGAGGHSTVRLAYRTEDPTAEPVACKFIKHRSVWHWETCAVTSRQYPLEIKVMRHIAKSNGGKGHPNIIKYYEHFELDGKFMIIMEYLGENWVDLYDFIEMFGPVKEDVSLEIFKRIVETLIDLHSLGYYHNDIKDENILIHTKTLQIKLIDFGSATPVPASFAAPILCDNFYGTKKFAAPEAVTGKPYDPEMQESWALGTLLFVMLFKLDPFTSDDEILTADINRRIAKFRSAYGRNAGARKADDFFNDDSELTGELGDIGDATAEALAAMMEKDPSRRLRVKDILKLPAIKKLKRRMR